MSSLETRVRTDAAPTRAKPPAAAKSLPDEQQQRKQPPPASPKGYADEPSDEPNGPTLRDLGSRGLVVYEKRETSEVFWQQREEDWRVEANLRSEPPAEVPASTIVARLEEGVFVNLDNMTNLDPPRSTPSAVATQAWRRNQSLKNIVLKENDKYYQVSIEKLGKLHEHAKGDAGVVVKRGAVVAAIPQNIIPSGTYCILVNLSSLQK